MLSSQVHEAWSKQWVDTQMAASEKLKKLRVTEKRNSARAAILAAEQRRQTFAAGRRKK